MENEDKIKIKQKGKFKKIKFTAFNSNTNLFTILSH